MSSIEQRARALDEARKVRIIKSEDIDTEKYLKAHDVSAKVRNATQWLDEMREDLINPSATTVGQTMPWPKTHTCFRFRPGEVTLYAGANGGGKSLITGLVALGLVSQYEAICIASFEMKPKRTLMRMLRQFSGEDIDAPRISGKEQYISNMVERFRRFSDGRVYLYDQQGTTSTNQVIAMARYCAMELGVTHVFIDSLMKCVSGEDDYNAQKSFVDEITAVARDHQIHIHLIHHIRKLQSEEVRPGKNDIKGSGAIADQVDNVLIMWRNKAKEHKANAGQPVSPADPDAMLMCEKQRNGESEDWFNLWFDRQSHQFVEIPDGVPLTFDKV